MMKAVVHFDERSAPDVLKLKNVMRPIPREDEVMIRVVACAVNREDIWRRLTNYIHWTHTSPILGFECSGYIVEKGSQVRDFNLLEEVCAVVRGGGAYAEYVTVPASSVLHVPPTLSLVEAASLPQAMYMVVYCFHVLRTITAGQKILIHGASGGIGVIALQYAKALGCEVFVTVGNKQKMVLCKELGANVCINRNKKNFSKIVKAETKGRGVDVIWDVNGSDYFEKNLDCLTVGGVLFLVAHKSGENMDIDFSIMKKKDIGIAGARLPSIGPSELAPLLHQAKAIFWPLIADGKIKPVVGKCFEFSEASKAHKAMEKHCVFGKVILVPD